MTQLRLSLLVVFFAMFVVACEEDVGCLGGDCIDDDACAQECDSICDGIAIDSICSDDGICSCECEFGCL